MAFLQPFLGIYVTLSSLKTTIHYIYWRKSTIFLLDYANFSINTLIIPVLLGVVRGLFQKVRHLTAADPPEGYLLLMLSRNPEYRAAILPGSIPYSLLIDSSVKTSSGVPVISTLPSEEMHITLSATMCASSSSCIDMMTPICRSSTSNLSRSRNSSLCRMSRYDVGSSSIMI